MTDVLDELRSVAIGNRVERFQGYDALARRADGLIGWMQQIEIALGATAPGSEKDWHDLATAAEALVAVSTAQEVWLADHDAALARAIEHVRGDIRSLNLSRDKPRGGDLA
jgi:uncharacterized protein YgfB (UPF0149 family)